MYFPVCWQSIRLESTRHLLEWGVTLKYAGWRCFNHRLAVSQKAGWRLIRSRRHHKGLFRVFTLGFELKELSLVRVSGTLKVWELQTESVRASGRRINLYMQKQEFLALYHQCLIDSKLIWDERKKCFMRMIADKHLEPGGSRDYDQRLDKAQSLPTTIH